MLVGLATILKTGLKNGVRSLLLLIFKISNWIYMFIDCSSIKCGYYCTVDYIIETYSITKF